MRLYIAKRWGTAEVGWLGRAMQVGALPESWKEYFRERMEHTHVG